MQSVNDWLHQFFSIEAVGLLRRRRAYFTTDDDLAAKMKQIRVHGQDRRYHHPVIGMTGALIFAGGILSRSSIGSRK